MNNQELTVNTLRMLSVDEVERANSGHPGLPLGAAPMAYELWSKHMSHNPKDPKWLNRDRFVLSAGHGSALLYALLYLFDYGLTIEDLKEFRQLGSKTPGHPEYGHTVGVECTTGPLGAGISMAVGMAMAERALAAKYNKPDLELINHYTYVICGDGDLMEGVSNEASSLAGTLALEKLIVLYDSNQITIEGSTNLAFHENVRGRYEALGWNTLEVVDGNDLEEIGKIIAKAKTGNKPTLIEIHTNIGYGSPKEGMASAHGEPLGKENSEITREALGLKGEQEFSVPKEVENEMKIVQSSLEEKTKTWKNVEEKYKETYPEEYQQLLLDVDCNWDLNFLETDEFWATEGDMATRASSGKVLNRIAKELPILFGGSADLAPSNKSNMNDVPSFSKENFLGRNIHFGIREHAMAAIANGIALHGGWHPYVATFLVFADYMKPQLRLSALMGTPVTYIFTHDSIGVGEDGPTHQPIEHLAMLRSIPNLITFRPADTTEVCAGWHVAMHSKHTPVAMALSRQTLPELEGSSRDAVNGGYILKKENNKLDLILFASGSEVHLAVEAAKELEEKGYGVRVVSIPSQELFEAKSATYRNEVIPTSCKKRISIEAGTTFGWDRYVGLEGRCIGINDFGASGPGSQVFEYFGITKERIVKEAMELL